MSLFKLRYYLEGPSFVGSNKNDGLATLGKVKEPVIYSFYYLHLAFTKEKLVPIVIIVSI